MYKTNPNIVERKIHDTFFLINTKQNYTNEKCYLYEINEIGEFIWQNIDKYEDLNEVVHMLACRLTDDIDYDIIYNDVKIFVNQLIEIGFLEEI